MSLTISRWEELAPPPDCPEALGRAESDYGPEPRRGRLGASLAYALRVERRATSRSGGPEHLGREPEQVARAVARLLVTTVAAVGLMFLASALPARAASATTQGHAVPLQTPAGGEFLSPSGNISCEVDDGYAGLHQVYCQTFSPPESVTMSTRGVLKKCTGESCLGNPAVNAPTLPYGSSTGVGPFQCLSATDGVTCTASGKGFRISRSGIVVVRKPARA